MLPLDWFSMETIDQIIQRIKYSLWLAAIKFVLSSRSGKLIGIYRLSNRRYFKYPA